MNRTIIRILGACVACITGFAQQVFAATTTVSGVYNHSNYSGTVTYPIYNGYFASAHNGCTTSGNGTVTCDFDTNVCNDVYSTGSATGTGTGGDITSYGEDSMRCQQYKCIKSGGYYIPNCNGNAKCDGTGMYCQNTGFFSRYGVAYTGTSWGGPASGHSYRFVGCETGWYLASTTNICKGTTTTNATGNFSGCCAPCPGMREFDAKTASSVTYVHGTDSNSISGYWWAAPTGSGITSCVAYPPQTTYKDDAGTYSLESGCPYKN